jgi:hypothetical protein
LDRCATIITFANDFGGGLTLGPQRTSIFGRIVYQEYTLRLCLSSRHYPNIALNNCPEIWAERRNQHDIKAFTHKKLSHMSDTSENRRLVESILSQADGVFLWVDLVTNEMLMADGDGETLSQKMERLKKTPNGLDDLYTQIFYKLSEKERIDTFQIFKWVLHASRRLSPLELCFALQPNHYLRFMESLRTIHRQGCPDEPIYIRSRSRGLLEIRSVVDQNSASSSPSSDIIQFIHQTVPELLLRKGLELLQPSINISFGRSENRCCRRCAAFTGRRSGDRGTHPNR